MSLVLSSWCKRRSNEKDSLVYICSKYKADSIVDVRKNIENAEEYSKFAYAQGYLPICVHICLDAMTGLHESTGDREELLHAGKRYVRLCNQLWVFGDISEGMRGEIAEADRIHIPTLYFDNKMNMLERHGS